LILELFLGEDPDSEWVYFEVGDGNQLGRGWNTSGFSLSENFHLYRKKMEILAILPVFGYWETCGRARNEYMNFSGARA